MKKNRQMRLTPRADSLVRKIPESDWLRFLEDSRRIQNPKDHIAQLNRQYNLQITRSRYYRARAWLEKREDNLRLCRTINNHSDECGDQRDTLLSSRVLTAIQELKKDVDSIKQKQSIMASEMRTISVARTDAFIMYMNMRNLNRIIRNSSYVADVLDMTKDIPYPGDRKRGVDAIAAKLLRLNKETEKRIDATLECGFKGHFDGKGLTDKDMFMLRLRFIWGCDIINELEKDSQIPLAKGEESISDVFTSTFSPAVLFVDLWHDIGETWLRDAAYVVYKCGKFVTPYERTRGIVREMRIFQGIRDNKK